MVHVVRADEPDETTLSNLMQLYLNDFSENDGSQISAEGLFHYPHLSTYFSETDRHAYLIWADESLAGFALIKKGSEIARDEQSMDVAEFFVLRSHRLKGVGRAAFGKVVLQFPGPWIVRVQDGYHAALAFWRHSIPAVAISEFESEIIEDGRRNWIVFKFETADAVRIGSPSTASN